MSIQIHLDNFDGPLDLLLHLIKTNEMDIYDIQMVAITEQYLAILEQMQQLDLDVAGEFLLMAATLIHIKSRLLLPVGEDAADAEEEDPRAELVRRLLEYQRYKEVAVTLDRLPRLDRDIFLGHFQPTDLTESDGGDEIAVEIFHLAEAFHHLLKNIPAEVFHEVIREQLSVADHVQLIIERLTPGGRVGFREIFPSRPSRPEVVVTFLAMLELVRMRLVKVEQSAQFSEIWLSLAVSDQSPSTALPGEAALGYE